MKGWEFAAFVAVLVGTIAWAALHTRGENRFEAACSRAGGVYVRLYRGDSQCFAPSALVRVPR